MSSPSRAPTWKVTQLRRELVELQQRPPAGPQHDLQLAQLKESLHKQLRRERNSLPRRAGSSRSSRRGSPGRDTLDIQDIHSLLLRKLSC